MYQGGITSIVSSDKNITISIADKLGKLHENSNIKIYYRKRGEYIRSILISTNYPEKILDLAELISLSSLVIFHLPIELSWMDGELAMLIDAFNIHNKIITSNLDIIKIKKILEPLGSFRQFELNNDLNKIQEFKEEDKGLVYIDRVFTVKGVGTVVTGFSFTNVELHEKLIALPYNREVEIKSIQVLDEDQKSVGSGVRVGFALKNVKEDEVKDIMYLIKHDVKFEKEIEGRLVKYPWSTLNQGQNHVIIKGHSISVNIKLNEGKIKITSQYPIPIIDSQIPLLNVNVKQGKPRIIGYIIL
ncbi:translation elongation factor [Saccharolobus caldissimus]|uniref:Translation elongation factor n=1 Tax=Saccharolobus caldissimus TaxID=1702097 RepID=A0AAQ4CP09_9CREN|nr:translation elongation factor [Saccharolobus caldissimus]BDB97540.1 translation elongation factor [Saccharolobus caldissimus]